jgi:hypothetical protein
VRRRYVRGLDDVEGMTEATYTREEMREACRTNYAAGRAKALEEATQVVERMSRYARGVGEPGFTEAFNELCSTLIQAIRALKEH